MFFKKKKKRTAIEAKIEKNDIFSVNPNPGPQKSHSALQASVITFFTVYIFYFYDIFYIFTFLTFYIFLLFTF